MKTVIYLDKLLLTNFLAASMLLLCTGLLCARQCSGLRLKAGSTAAVLPGVHSANLCGYPALSRGVCCCAADGAVLLLWPGGAPQRCRRSGAG